MDLLDKMATFVRVFEAGSFSLAARQLRISAAAVSRQIATLEAGLGTPLLLRTTRRMTSTAAGRRYYDQCVRILRDVEEAQRIGCGDELRGVLKISAPVSFGLARVAPHMHALMKRHPGLEVDLRIEDRLVDLSLDGVDVAIRVAVPPPESTSVVAHELTTFQRVLVAAPAYLRRRGTPKTPEALGKHDVLTGPATAAWALVSAEREVAIELEPRVRCNAIQAVHAMVLDGAGIAALPEWLVAYDLRSHTLRRVLPGWSCPTLTVHALHRTQLRGAHRVRALIDHLRAAYAQSPT